MNKTRKYCISVFLVGAIFPLIAPIAAGESDATRQLIARNSEFRKEIVKVSQSVYTAVGYGVSPVSMIIGVDGLVIIDTGVDVASAVEVRSDFRLITDKPVKAIVFTHGHGDHTGGASAFMDAPVVQIWARGELGHEQHFLETAGIKIQKRRGARQAGFALSAEQRINNGVARAYWPDKANAVFSKHEKLKPTHRLEAQRQTISVAGLDLELVAANGETQDHLYVWFPKERVAFSGDNFYKSWPNLYAIRGTEYRDILHWIGAIDSILKEQPVNLVGGHTRPILGEELVNETLTNFRDAVQFLFDKTVEGINKGMTPDQLVDYVVLPEKYAQLDYLQPYYGHPAWAVRSIFNGYLGWFDGNPSNLFPLSDKEEASRISEIVGGTEKLLALAESAYDDKDYQWAAQLCDHVLSMESDNDTALLVKANALTMLADGVLTATARNYYLSSAIELRARAQH